MALPTPALPTVTSLPLPDPEAYPGEPREYATALMQRKEEIEKAMDELRNVLASHGTNTSTPLVDPEGYPRGDIDIYAIRHARSALAHLVTDLRTVNDLLPNALALAFQANPAASSSSSEPAPSTKVNGVNGHGPSVVRGGAADDMPEAWPERAIARVNSVALNSPAAEADLRAEDLIHSFSGVTSTHPGGLQAIGALVQQSEGTTLTILVLRGTERIRLRLTPRTGWGGRGSLGCHIVPA
ncbi:hypothetical protein DB88DRAFT_277182 [Papiliotrema laurentii]|uniref:Probable 26S proteasome regulatory subunit p27 n=1 Tax=Papiliotrema laurentii TaxID=5418 RepID=A0AAD9CY99_PAPLA|nr:hypothetical protein DB88DRAFT_277182 [Papiliotrema laurentii]